MSIMSIYDHSNSMNFQYFVVISTFHLSPNAMEVAHAGMETILDVSGAETRFQAPHVQQDHRL